jgi:hypothetical protein
VIAKHRQAALRFGFGRFILQNIPVFSEAATRDGNAKCAKQPIILLLLKRRTGKIDHAIEPPGLALVSSPAG